jgi:hypothetical protein
MPLTVPGLRQDSSSSGPSEVDLMMALATMKDLGRIPENRPPIYKNPQALGDAFVKPGSDEGIMNSLEMKQGMKEQDDQARKDWSKGRRRFNEPAPFVFDEKKI